MFRIIFGEIITLLIALKFNHTLQYAVTREPSIIQTKIVVLIALLALARKFINVNPQPCFYAAAKFAQKHRLEKPTLTLLSVCGLESEIWNLPSAL